MRWCRLAKKAAEGEFKDESRADIPRLMERSRAKHALHRDFSELPSSCDLHSGGFYAGMRSAAASRFQTEISYSLLDDIPRIIFPDVSIKPRRILLKFVPRN